MIVDDLEVASVLEEALLASVPAPAHVERGWAVIALDQPMAWDIGAFSPR